MDTYVVRPAVVPDVETEVTIWFVCEDEPDLANPDVAGPFDDRRAAEECAARMNLETAPPAPQPTRTTAGRPSSGRSGEGTTR